jgi:NTE family protein
MGDAGPPRVGVALGGGAARGLAHLGVLRALTQAAIRIDCMAGTSAGALIGSAFCAGLDPAHLIEIAADVGWRNMASPAFSLRGLFSFERLESWLVALLGDLDFADLAIPFAAVATDVQTGEAVIMTEGRLAPAVRASCSMPGIITPAVRDGRLLVDGAISDNLPVAATRALGAGYVIAVDICIPRQGWRLGPLSAALNAVETLVRRAGGGWDTADCVITPDLCQYGYLSFRRYEELVEHGAAAVEAQLPSIHAALAEARQAR